MSGESKGTKENQQRMGIHEAAVSKMLVLGFRLEAPLEIHIITGRGRLLHERRGGGVMEGRQGNPPQACINNKQMHKSGLNKGKTTDGNQSEHDMHTSAPFMCMTNGYHTK